MLACARKLIFPHTQVYNLNELLNSNSRKSQYVIPEAKAPAITLILSSIKSRNVVAGLKSAPSIPE